MNAGFAVWLTGRPAAGKTTAARLLRDALWARDVPVLWLDSDDVRSVVTPHPVYSDAERERFYAALVHIARRATEGGVPVILSATAMRSRWVDALRRVVKRCMEVRLDCSLEEATRRDPKGLYAAARAGAMAGLPGVDGPLEASEQTDLELSADRMSPPEITDAILRWLDAKQWLRDPMPAI